MEGVEGLETGLKAAGFYFAADIFGELGIFGLGIGGGKSLEEQVGWRSNYRAPSEVCFVSQTGEKMKKFGSEKGHEL